MAQQQQQTEYTTQKKVKTNSHNKAVLLLNCLGSEVNVRYMYSLYGKSSIIFYHIFDLYSTYILHMFPILYIVYYIYKHTLIFFSFFSFFFF